MRITEMRLVEPGLELEADAWLAMVFSPGESSEKHTASFPKMEKQRPEQNKNISPNGVSHEVRRGVQVASRVAIWKSGLHGRGKGERVIALKSG